MSDMAATGFNIQDAGQVAQDLRSASRHLRREATVPAGVLGLLQDLCERIGDASPADLRDVSPTDWMGIQSAALRTLKAIRHDDDERRQRREIRLLLEELRFRFDRLAEREPVSDDRPSKEVVRWLDGVWSVPQAAKGELFDVTDRTWQRWASPSATSQPTGDHDRQVRLVARAVSELRFLLTGNGVLEWLQDADPELGNRTPMQVIAQGDPEALASLFGLITRARTGAAA